MLEWFLSQMFDSNHLARVSISYSPLGCALSTIRQCKSMARGIVIVNDISYPFRSHGQ